MTMPPTKPPAENDEEEIDERERQREGQFGGQLRWVYTGCLVISVWLTISSARKQPAMALIGLICAVAFTFWARTNWRNWQKKSDAEKAPLLFLPKLQIRDISVPFTRADFKHNEDAMMLNMIFAVFGGMFSLGLAAIFRPALPWGTRLFMILPGAVGAWSFFTCGKRFLRGQKTLACPGCKEVLMTRRVFETGCCRKCGRQVLAD